jgi:hypothetical protein
MLCTKEAEAEAEEKIKLKQYVSLRSKGRHNQQSDTSYFQIVNFQLLCQFSSIPAAPV